jgi:hypothetical protein
MLVAYIYDLTPQQTVAWLGRSTYAVLVGHVGEQ